MSALFTVTPLSIFAQVELTTIFICFPLTQIFKNNGVIAITRCANRAAGRWCCVFLILFGVLGKISGVFLASACITSPNYPDSGFPSQYPIRFSGESPPSSLPVSPYPAFVFCRTTGSPVGIASSSVRPYPSGLVISSYLASSPISSTVSKTRIRACKVFLILSLSS